MTDDATNSQSVNDENLSDLHGRIKAIGQLSISATAKLIGITVLTTGIKSAADIADMIGIPKSTVYRALSDVFEHAGELILTIPTVLTRLTSENLTVLTDEKDREKVVSLVSPVRISEPEPSCAPNITSRATKELPSEVVIENNIPPLAPPTPKTAKPKTEKRGTRLPDEWELPEDWRQWALVNCPISSAERIEIEGHKFANHWQASAGQNARKCNWYKAWQNWCYRAFASAPIRPAAQVPSWMDRERQERREFLAMARGETLNG